MRYGAGGCRIYGLLLSHKMGRDKLSNSKTLFYNVGEREKLTPCSRLYVPGRIPLQSSPLTNTTHSKLPRWEESNSAWSFSKASHYEECPVFRRRTRKCTVWLHHCFMWQTGLELVRAITSVGISWNRNQQIGPVDRCFLSWKYYVSWKWEFQTKWNANLPTVFRW